MDKGYTKHYFEEGKRICSKIGSGELRDINDLVGHIERNYEDQQNMQNHGIRDMYCLQNAWFDLENDNLYETIVRLYEGQIHSDEPIFYYHSDHLGSASFLTDNNGKETQQLVYLPYGEDWVDLKYNTQQFETPYKFNGKEKDLESGYNYYGARYYYDWLSIWLSVDPLSDKYPHLTSYNYCANNPVMLVDPDGREFDPVQDKQYIKPIEKEAKARMESLQKKMGDLDPGSEKYQNLKNQYDQYNSTLTEIGELRADKDNLYLLNFGEKISNDGSGEVRYGGTNDRGMNVININIKSKIPHGNIGTIAHELKHAYQFFSGDLGFALDKNGKQVTTNNSMYLEKQAGIRGDLFFGFPHKGDLTDYKLDDRYILRGIYRKEKFTADQQNIGRTVIFNR